MGAPRVTHLGAADAGGGAARAMLRLSAALRSAGVASTVIVGSRKTGDAQVAQHGLLERWTPGLRARIDRAPARLYARRSGGPFHPALVPDRVASALRASRPSVVNLHWIAGGFMRLETLGKLAAPVVWTLQDSWPFTGGCHVPLDCERFVERCGACPVLGSRVERDLSRLVWWRKARAWREVAFTAVAPSTWMAVRARRSSLFSGRRVEVIPNGVDTSVFRPIDRREARAQLGLPLEAPTVLFAALYADRDANKGFHLLAPALAGMQLRAGGRPLLLVAGNSTLHRHASLGGLPARTLGWIQDDAGMARALAAADVVAVPSMQENFPYAALEALACGRPVVGFRTSGLPDLVRDGANGLLAPPFEVAALREALRVLLEDPSRAAAMGLDGRAEVERGLGLASWAGRYRALYDDLLRSAQTR
jgi:glycosyltransferase involved in cell wall biosynthesis